jgi:hypothetical protein
MHDKGGGDPGPRGIEHAPEAMLRDLWTIKDPEVRLCAGDDQTGFYRRCGDSDSAGLVTEAYSWGQLTAGNRAKKDIQRAGWALLLPFALVNVALWARPDVSDGRLGQVTAYVLRLLAVSLTVTLVLAAAGVGHRSVCALNKDIRTWIETWNHQPRPYVWTKTADQILESIARYCTRINDSRH